jgi:hypothetical protein
MNGHSIMKELLALNKNISHNFKNGLQVLITVISYDQSTSRLPGYNRHYHLASVVLLLSFLSLCTLFACYIVMPYAYDYAGAGNLLPFILEPVIAQEQPTSMPSTTNDSNSSSIQPQVSGNDTAAAETNATSLSPGIQIAYPKGWIANDIGNGTVRFSTPLRTDLMRFTVNVVNIPPSLQNMTLDNIVELNLNTLKQQLSNFSLAETNTTTLSPENQTAHKIVYTNTNKDPNFPLGFKTMQIFAIKDGQIVTLSYVSEQSQYQRFLPTIERMLDSVTFKKG